VGVILGGILSRLLSYSIPFIGGFIPWIIAFAVGLLTAEAISRATGYKRGVGLQVVAAICLVLGYFIGNPLLLLATTYLLVGRIAIVPFWAWLNFYSIIYLLLAILAAVGRLR
jgi:nitrate reductase gamma subunit